MAKILTANGISKKMQNYITAQDMGAGFLANVILNQHSSAGRKLAGLVKLLKAGRTASTGQFSIDTLVIDGEGATWETLETI